jgi:hypothetical protein
MAQIMRFMIKLTKTDHFSIIFNIISNKNIICAADLKINQMMKDCLNN